METWLSYAPGDFLMFGPEVYWRLFELQNRALWPLPVIAGLAGVACLVLVATRRPVAIRAVLILAALACLGAAHFLATRYAPINWPMVYLGSSFKCNTQSPLGIGCCDGHTKQAPQQRGTWRDISRA
jgi:hypothetical protein